MIPSLQTTYHQSPINPEIFPWWWSLWTVFEVFLLFWPLLLSKEPTATTPNQQPTSNNNLSQQELCTDLFTETAVSNFQPRPSWVCPLLLGKELQQQRPASTQPSCVQQPAAASLVADPSPTWTCSLFNWDDGLSWWVGPAGLCNTGSPPAPPSHPSSFCHSFGLTFGFP